MNTHCKIRLAKGKSGRRSRQSINAARKVGHPSVAVGYRKLVPEPAALTSRCGGFYGQAEDGLQQGDTSNSN